MSFSTELEQLQKNKAELKNELQSMERREKALREILSILEEKLAVQETARLPLLEKTLEWCSSPETVRLLYTS